jgi:hypothetical protein
MKIKTILTLIVLLLICKVVQSQSKYTEEQINEKLDSILKEGNLLYRLERAAWVSTDLARENKKIKKEFNGYLVYSIEDTIRAIILNKDNQCIYELSFVKELTNPVKEIINERTLTLHENTLVTMKKKIIAQIIETKINVTCPEGYNLNFEIIPFETGYKFYILTGTSHSDVIPFGNDYLINSDLEGKILSWKKFHSGLIPCMTKIEDAKVIEISHSHLRKEPFISATDICTFKLYAKLYDLSEFSVYSPEFSGYFKYSLTEDKIIFQKK